MRGTFEDPPVVIYQARWKMSAVALPANFVAVSLVFTSNDILRDAWVLMIIALAAIYLDLLLWRPGFIRLGPEGVSVRTLFQTNSCRWDKVSDEPRLASWGFSRVHCGAVTAPGLLEMNPFALMKLVKCAKAHWSDRSGH